MDAFGGGGLSPLTLCGMGLVLAPTAWMMAGQASAWGEITPAQGETAPIESEC